MYNLGLAYDAANDLARAQEMFAAAARVKEKDLYREALQRVQTRDREFRVMAAQTRTQNDGLPARDTGLTGTPPEAQAQNLPVYSPTNWSPDLRATSGDAVPSAAPTQPADWMPASPSLPPDVRRLPVDESPVR